VLGTPAVGNENTRLGLDPVEMGEASAEGNEGEDRGRRSNVSDEPS
jgi:hypothetical protein